MSLTSLEIREFLILKYSYSLGTDEKENSTYSSETEGDYFEVVNQPAIICALLS